MIRIFYFTCVQHEDEELDSLLKYVISNVIHYMNSA